MSRGSLVTFSLTKRGDRGKAMLRISNSAIYGKLEDARRCSCDKGELRCGCGNLMARVNSRGIELKCRRCKRIIIVPLSMGNSENQKNGRGF